MQACEIKIKLAPKLRPLFKTPDKRYRVAYGGRGGSKSWAFADVALLRCCSEKTSITVCRELQTTIKDSVHQLLKDRISVHGLNSFFDITENGIVCSNGSTIRYKHLHNNYQEIKGLEGTDVCWVFEAENVSKDSWDVLDPTIRKPGAEVWVEFNPKSKSDHVYDFFITHPKENAIVVKINYTDNPWCPQSLKDLAEECKRNRPEEYRHIWEGEPAGIGQFFNTFGIHNLEAPFMLPYDCQGSLIGSLDHGIVHPTSFGLNYIDQGNKIHRLITYCCNGLTTKNHALNIWDMLDSFKWTHGMMPKVIYYDPSMEAKRRLSEQFYRSDIDEYLDVFKASQKSQGVIFTPANNRKIDGCHIMRQVFSPVGEEKVPEFYYFDGYNKSFVDGILSVMTDENNVEIYAKQDGDDCADEARYGIVAAWTEIARRKAQDEIVSKKPPQRAREFYAMEQSLGWMA